MQLHGGEAEGTAEIDVGGDVVVDGGLAFAGSGGSIRMTTAKGFSSSSGDALLATANAGVSGTHTVSLFPVISCYLTVVCILTALIMYSLYRSAGMLVI